MLQRVKCQVTRRVTEAQKNKKMRRDYKLSKVTHEYDNMFQDCVKRKGQVEVYKKENQKRFLSFDDFIRNDDGSDKVISSYFKEVKIRELQIWKGDKKRVAGTMSDDGHLLTDDESRKKNFQELRERKFKLKN